MLTYDFDVFCVFPPQTGLRLDPTSVLNFLRQQGYLFGKEDRITIAGVPVQFIPVSEGLVTEAVMHAVSLSISSVPTKIFPVEYLIAMMLQLNRSKDRAKVDLLIHNESVMINLDILEPILTRFHLMNRWERINAID